MAPKMISSTRSFSCSVEYYGALGTWSRGWVVEMLALEAAEVLLTAAASLLSWTHSLVQKCCMFYLEQLFANWSRSVNLTLWWKFLSTVLWYEGEGDQNYCLQPLGGWPGAAWARLWYKPLCKSPSADSWEIFVLLINEGGPRTWEFASIDTTMWTVIWILQDIQVRGANRDEKKIMMAQRYPNSRHFLTYRHSLRVQ